MDAEKIIDQCGLRGFGNETEHVLVFLSDGDWHSEHAFDAYMRERRGDPAKVYTARIGIDLMPPMNGAHHIFAVQALCANDLVEADVRDGSVYYRLKTEARK